MSESREALRERIAHALDALWADSPDDRYPGIAEEADAVLAVVGPALDAADRLADAAANELGWHPYSATALHRALDAWREASRG